MNYNVSVFGVKDTTKTIIEYICDDVDIFDVDLIVTIDEKIEAQTDISGYENLQPTAKKYKAEIFKAKSYDLTDEKSHEFFQKNNFDVAISIGWQRLIPKHVLDAFEYGIFGFHGSCAYLPFGRGRSPLNWSLVLGDRRFILNMIKYDKKPDSPNIFSKKMWEINDFDDIRTMQYKNLICSKKQVKELLKAYKKNNIKIDTISKDPETWYEKRNPEDGRIKFDWRTRKIYNLIRAVTHPFPGAFCYCKEIKVFIWEAFLFDKILDFSGYKVGEVIDIFDGNPVIRTLDGSIIIKEYESEKELKKGDVLY